MNIEVVNMQIHHVYELANNLRPGDIAECEALGFTPKWTIRKAYNDSVMKKVTLLNGKVAAGWGITGVVLGQIGHPWLLTSIEVDKAPFHLACVYRKEVKKMLEFYPKLENWCDSRYSKSLKLLKLVGFHVEDPKPYGPNNMLFCRFTMSI